MVVRDDCGFRTYQAERTKFLQRRDADNAVFYSGVEFAWVHELDGGRFEDLDLQEAVLFARGET